MSRSTWIGLAVLSALAVATAAWLGVNPQDGIAKLKGSGEASKSTKAQTMPAPSVSVVRASVADFGETVLVTGTIVPREEIQIAPEIEGLRIIEVLVDEGQSVKKGDVLARVEQETLDAQAAQNTAQLARSNAAIEQARSAIVQAEARLKEAKTSFDRAKPLKQSGYLSESTFDQRESAARTADALLVAARDGLKLAEADRSLVEAQRRELEFRRGRTEMRAPADGLVSRRNARIGSIATGAGEAMFRIIAKGEFELDGEVTETRIAKLKAGQPVRIDVAGAGEVTGTVRYVSPEVDRTTRLGRARVFIGTNSALKVGVFGRGLVETAKSRGLSLPASAILYSENGASVQAVVGDKVETRRVETGLVSGGQVEILKGIAEGELIVSRAGSFLRGGDIVRPVLAESKVSDAGVIGDGLVQDTAINDRVVKDSAQKNKAVEDSLGGAAK